MKYGKNVKPGYKTWSLFVALAAIICAAAWVQFGGLLIARVPTVNVAELVQGMNGQGIPERSITDAKPMLLVDVREPEESAVSMIPGAVTAADYELNPQRYADRRIVPYCTVGYRSGKYTEKLLRNGVDAVNFEGSIMAWVEAGLPLVTPDGEDTVRVHTWSRSIRAPAGYVQVVD